MKIEFNPQKNFSLLQYGRRFFVYSSSMAAVTSCEHTLYIEPWKSWQCYNYASTVYSWWLHKWHGYSFLINHKQHTNPQFTLAKGLVTALETSAFLSFFCDDWIFMNSIGGTVNYQGKSHFKRSCHLSFFSQTERRHLVLVRGMYNLLSPCNAHLYSQGSLIHGVLCPSW